MVTAASWLLGFVLAIGFTAAGSAKVADKSVMTKARHHLGLARGAYRLIGAAEILGAIGLILGLLDPLVWLGFFAGCGLLMLMVGAVMAHLRVGDPRAEAAPAAAMAVISFLYLATRALA